MKRLSFLLCLFVISGSLGAAEVESVAERSLSVLRVNVTTQPYDFFNPWSKKAPNSRRALGTVIENDRVLVTGELVANASFVELEKPESGEKIPAEVDVVDYEANLAILKPADPAFLNGFKALERTEVRVGDPVVLWQLENTGALLSTSGVVTTVEVSGYPVEGIGLLVYRVTSSVQYRDSSFTMPIVKDNKLAGLLMRFDPRTQNVDAVPAPIIEHFLKAAAQRPYRGFPRAGIDYSPMRDPQLRRYAGLNGAHKGTGVYVTDVLPKSPAAKAGIRAGDVILAVGGEPIDQDGNYSEKLYGKVSLSHLISGRGFVGDQVPVKLWREGKDLSVNVTLDHRSPQDFVIEPYTIDRAPRYYVLGGLVFQELSRQYLKEWGEWTKKAPERLVYYERYQAELFKDGERQRLVILSQVLPSPATVGYEELASLVVTKVNGVTLKSLADLPAAVEKPMEGFHKVEFEEGPCEIYLDAREVSEGNKALMRNYGLPALENLNF